MQNGNGNHPERSTQPLPYGTPEGDLVVFAGERAHRYASPLNRLKDGTPVIAAGVVNEVREHGSLDAPRATLVLINDFGQATYAAADTSTLTEYGLFLMDGVEVSLHGVCRRPFVDGPPYIQIVRVEPLTG
jgi:hypothetical protein